jgi:hypothetical protein
MTNHPFLPVGNRAGRVRRPQTLSLLLGWSSFAVRAAVRRTCNAVTLRCQRVLARYRPTRDEVEHVAMGDPDPGLTPHHPVCRFEWEDEVDTRRESRFYGAFLAARDSHGPTGAG